MNLTTEDCEHLLRWGLFYFYCNRYWDGPKEHPTLQKLLDLILPTNQQIKVETMKEVKEIKGTIPIKILEENQKKAKSTLDSWLKTGKAIL